MARGRALIITSAGCSTRFSRSVGRDLLKVLYTEGSGDECLLAGQLSLVADAGFDSIIIVGGYEFDELRDFVARGGPRNSAVETVFNDKFREYGTAHSLACGLKALGNRDFDEIVFMEGDLFFDAASFARMVAADGDVVTANRDLVRAEKSVVFYVTGDGRLRYIYDPRHRSLHIPEPFKILGNSGQVWKFRNAALLHQVMEEMGPGICEATNLVPIERYFNALGLEQVIFSTFDAWFNCNTIDDFRAIRRYKEALCTI